MAAAHEAIFFRLTKTEHSWFPVAALCLSMLVAGCGGGGGGGDDGGGNGGAATLNVVQSQAVPGGFVTLQDDSLTTGESVQVTFSNNTGYTVTFGSVPAADGRAEIPVPPWFDGVTGEIAAGTYTLALADGRSAQVEVAAPTELVGVAPGTLIQAYLQALRDKYALMLSELDAFQLDFGYDVSADRANIQRAMADLDQSLQELATTGTLSAYSPVSGSVPLTQEELAILDQWLGMLAAGYVGQFPVSAQAHSGAVRAAAMSADELVAWINSWVNPTTFPEAITEGIRERQDTVVYQSLAELKAFLAAKLGIFGEVLGEKVGAVRSLLQHLVQGTFQTVANLSRSMTAGDEFEVAPELIKVAPDVLEVVSPPSRLKDLIGDLQTWVNRLTWLCDQVTPVGGVDISDWHVDCDSIRRVRGLTSESKFALRLVGGPSATSGEPVNLLLVLYESLPGSGLGATNNTITVDWGDRPANDTSALEKVVRGPQTGTPAFGELTLQHTYHLPSGVDEKDYTVIVTLQGDNSEVPYIISAVYQVWSGVEPLVVDATLPEPPIAVDEGNYYEFQVSGGWKPYHLDIDWGDGKRQSTDSENLGKVRGGHRYHQAGAYEIRLEVTDSAEDSLQRVYPIGVGIPAPTGLATLCPSTLTVVTPGADTRTLLYSGFREDTDQRRAECAYYFGETGIHLDIEYAPDAANGAGCGQSSGTAGWIYQGVGHQVLGTEQQLRVALGLEDYPSGAFESLVQESAQLGAVLQAASDAGLGEACSSAPAPSGLVADFDHVTGGPWDVGPVASGRTFTFCGSAEVVGTGGLPDAYLTHTEFCDVNESWYFWAPSTWSGDLSGAFGKSLSFDLKSQITPYAGIQAPFVVLEGAGKLLFITAGELMQIADEWFHFQVALRANASAPWRVTTSSMLLGPSQAATDNDVRDVLGTLRSVRILGGYGGNGDTTGLDNVVLGGI